MNTSIRRSRGTDWLGVVSFGFFLVAIGSVWMMTPNLHDKAIEFIRDFELKEVAGNISLPSPNHHHPILYNAAMQVCLVLAVFQIALLILRFAMREPVDRKADSASGMAFWFSAAYFLNMLASESIGWFGFLAGVVVSAGLAILASSLVKLFR